MAYSAEMIELIARFTASPAGGTEGDVASAEGGFAPELFDSLIGATSWGSSSGYAIRERPFRGFSSL